MEVTDSDIAEFKELYKAKFNKVIDTQTARHKLTMLVRQVELVHQPITKKQLEELARRDAIKTDAEALARLIYDIYKEKNRGKMV